MCCKKNSLLITESERTYIKNLYGLLTEAITGEDQITLTADSTFGPGKYSQLSPSGMEELNAGIKEASAWLTENKGSIIFVQIVAGESQITNYDSEQDPKIPVAPKVLSRLRSKTLKRYLNQVFKGLVDSGVIKEMPIFQEPRIEIGKTKYTKGQSISPALRAIYNTEQFVKVELKLMAPEKCLVNLEIEVKYEKETNAAFPCRGGHTCNDATFDVKMNGVSIGRADLNNLKDSGSRTSGILKIDDAKAKQIIGVNTKIITFSLRCLSGQNCHSGTPEIVIKKNNETIYHSCSPAISRGDQNEYPILTLDPCGNVTQKGTGDATNKDTPVQQTTVKGYILTLPQDIDQTKEYFVCGLTGGLGAERLILKSPKGDCSLFIKKGGEAIVGPRGLIYEDKNDNKRLMDVDPGTVITNVVNYGEPNANPLPIKKPNGLTNNMDSGSGKYHVEMEKGEFSQGFTYFFKPGPGKYTLEDEKLKNIVRFKLDDEAIEDFENYYIPNKLVEKTPDGTYKVIANKITYASNVYNKDTILKLDS